MHCPIAWLPLQAVVTVQLGDFCTQRGALGVRKACCALHHGHCIGQPLLLACQGFDCCSAGRCDLQCSKVFQAKPYLELWVCTCKSGELRNFPSFQLPVWPILRTSIE